MAMMRLAAQRYLQLRRSLGYELDEPGRLVLDFADHLDALGVMCLTIDVVVAWATTPQGTAPYWHWLRLSAVRGLGVSGVLCNGGEISEVITGMNRFSRKVAVDDKRDGARHAGAGRVGGSGADGGVGCTGFSDGAAGRGAGGAVRAGG